jgi:hypothetical protein
VPARDIHIQTVIILKTTSSYSGCQKTYRSIRILTLDFYTITVASRVCYVNSKIQAVRVKFLKRKLNMNVCWKEGSERSKVQSLSLWRGSEENHRKPQSLCSFPRLWSQPRNIFIWIWISNPQHWHLMFSQHWILRFQSSGCGAI